MAIITSIFQQGTYIIHLKLKTHHIHDTSPSIVHPLKPDTSTFYRPTNQF